MKKLNKFFTVLVALAMMATLCVSMAFAAPEATGNQIGTEAGANLVKYLQLPSGATIPTKDFVFKFDKFSDSTHADLAKDMPAIADQTISTSDMIASASDADGNSLVGTIKLADLVKAPATIPDPENAGQTIANPDAGKLLFKHAGEYIYKVTETNTATTGDGWAYDGQTYRLHYLIKNGTNGLEIESITVQKGDTENAPKVNPNDVDPSDDETDPTTIDATNVDGFTFVNKYTPTEKEIDPEPENPSQGKYGALGVAKTVSGDNATKADAFPFEITLIAPANYNGALTVDAYIYNGDDRGAKKVVNINANDAANPTAFAFELKHGDSLVFPLLPDGVTYQVKEKLTQSGLADYTAYTPTLTATKANADTELAETLSEGGAASKGADLQMSKALKVNDSDTQDLAAYNNARDDITPTGILISNLPYIALALVAIGGLVAYVVVRRRQDDEA